MFSRAEKARIVAALILSTFIHIGIGTLAAPPSKATKAPPPRWVAVDFQQFSPTGLGSLSAPSPGAEKKETEISPPPQASPPLAQPSPSKTEKPRHKKTSVRRPPPPPSTKKREKSSTNSFSSPPAPAPISPPPSPPGLSPGQTKEPAETASAPSSPLSSPRSPEGESPASSPHPDVFPSSGRSSSRGDPDRLAAILAAYQRQVRARIEAAKEYPAEARLSTHRREGVVKVRFVVGAAGEVRSVAVVKSSGQEILDQAAVAAVRRAAPFPPLPPELNRTSLALVVPIKFVLK